MLGAKLLIAALTETPYQPRVENEHYAIEVSNRYVGSGAGDGVGLDTVTDARNVLEEFLSAVVPGAPKIRLERYKTRYTSMWAALAPGRRDHGDYWRVFYESLVEEARRNGLPLRKPQHGADIIERAPRTVDALRLGDYDITQHKLRQLHDAVTSYGHLITVL